MTEPTLNDNHSPLASKAHGPDAHGQAAMLLTESMLHGLIARKVISVAEAVDIVEVAAEVKEEVAADMGDTPSTMRQSLALLGSIRLSLKNDLPDAED